uniref:Uncharacterized protein n=1 Tax=Photinus pyralis TaxID=7054 RepID=A0A1Y1K6C9_PHOPY
MYHRLRRKCKYNPREYKSWRAYDRVMNRKCTIYRRKLIANGKLTDTLKMNAAERLFALLPGYLQWAKIWALEDWRERNRKEKDRLYQLVSSHNHITVQCMNQLNFSKNDDENLLSGRCVRGTRTA